MISVDDYKEVKDSIFFHENMGVYVIGDEPEEIFESIQNGETEE